MEQEIKDLLLHRETFYRSNEDGSFSRVDMLNEFYEDIKNFLKQEIDKAREEGRREALETLHLKLNDCTDIMAKIEKIIDHLNSQAQPEENEEWEKRFIRTFGYWAKK